MNRHQLRATAAALGSAVLAAGAAAADPAQVEVYGAIDLGLYAVDAAHSNASLQMKGTDISNLWGIRGREDLGDGRYVRFVLESGYDPDTGAVANDARSGAFFSRESLVILGSEDLGEIAFGRTAGFLGSTGTYAQWAANNLNPLMSNNPDGSLAGTFQSSPIMDNTVTVRSSPIAGGLRLLAQYSNSTNQVAYPESDGWHEAEHVWALGAAWKGEQTTAVLLWQMIDLADHASASAPDDAKSTQNIFAGASRFFGKTCVHVAWQHLENARGVLGTPNVISGEKMGFDAAGSVKGFRADSFSIGANHPLGAGRIHGSVKMVHAAWKGE